MENIYLETTAIFGRNGGLTPLSFIWDDQRVTIDHILGVLPMSSTKAGGAGYRYTCSSQGKQFILIYDGDGWYVEK